jgi:hypothetical protein
VADGPFRGAAGRADTRVTGTESLIGWQDIAPADAVDLDLTKRLDITAPRNENGQRCPWLWEPQQLTGVPLGQCRCSYCDAMCVAGMAHLDYTDGPLESVNAEGETG